MNVKPRDILKFKPRPYDQNDEGAFLPTEAEIAQQCLLIQMQWSAQERKLRQTACLHLPTEPSENVIRDARAARDWRLSQIRWNRREMLA